MNRRSFPKSPRLFSRKRFSSSLASGPGPLQAQGLFSTSPLVQGILPENLRFPAAGGIAVVLWNQWPAMLEELRELGRLLIITRNPHAVIGCHGAYPALGFSGEGARFASDGVGFAVDVGRWRQAVAIEERHAGGIRYAVEIVDAARQPLHKICLTAESDLPRFLEWVQVHQAAGLDPLPPLPSPVSAPVPAEPSAIAGPLAAFFETLMETGMEVRLTVGNDGISQTGCFSFQEMRRIGEWIFCSDGDAGWHVRPSGIDRLLLERCACGGACSPRLRAVCQEGRTVFLLAPGPSVSASAWLRLAHEAASEEA